MKTLPRISDAEWEVMKVLWAESPATANEVVDKLDGMGWSPKTIKTLINRLLKKGALDFKKRGRVYLYYPKLQQEECVRAEQKSFIKRVYGGSLVPMMANLIEDENLSQEELEELRRILNEKERD